MYLYSILYYQLSLHDVTRGRRFSETHCHNILYDNMGVAMMWQTLSSREFELLAQRAL